MHEILSPKDLKHTLDHLIQTARDTQLGYQAAAEHVENTELANLFQQYAQQRQQFVAELQQLEPPIEGEAPETEPTVGGKLQAGWIGFREAMNWQSEKVVLAEIGKMEKHAIGNVSNVLNRKVLPSRIADCLEKQLALYQEGASRAEVIYDDPNNSDRGVIPGTYTERTGTTPLGRAPVPKP